MEELTKIQDKILDKGVCVIISSEEEQSFLLSTPRFEEKNREKTCLITIIFTGLSKSISKGSKPL